MSRASIVGMLVAAEVLIVGVALYALGGRPGGFHGPIFAGGLHDADFVAKSVAPIEAGDAPRIAVDDPDSRIVVAASNDGLVHVKDLTNVRGAMFTDGGSVPQLNVRHTGDGVAISRHESNGSGLHFGIGSFDQRVEIDAPPGSHIDIARCAGADVSAIQGGVAVRSQDGRISLADLRGTVEGRTQDGSISASRVHGDTLALQSANGHLSLSDVAVSSLNARTSDGSIEARGLAIGGGTQPQAVLHSDDGSIRADGSFAPGGSYEISTQNGSIRLGLAPNADLTVNASTGNGKVLVDGSPFENSDGDSVRHTVKLGSGSGNLQLSSGDGSIHILTNGAV
ncbi:MAG: DUF4097 family beta strand repeat-containing protein [Candidatus Tumulicola sp.]